MHWMDFTGGPGPRTAAGARQPFGTGAEGDGLAPKEGHPFVNEISRGQPRKFLAEMELFGNLSPPGSLFSCRNCKDAALGPEVPQTHAASRQFFGHLA